MAVPNPKPINPTVPGQDPVGPVGPQAAAGAPKPKKNIFSAPLQRQKKAKLDEKKKNQKGSIIRLVLAVIFLGTYSFFFMYPQLQVYLSFASELEALEEQASDQESIISNLTEERDFHKAAYDEEFQEQQAVIDQVFPKDINKIEVIRLIEDYSAYLSNTYGEFEFSSISFSAPTKESGYTVLPFQTSITASRANFDRFLGLINLSGDLEGPDHIRLMNIGQISINYLGIDKSTGKDLGVNFSVSLNAFSQN